MKSKSIREFVSDNFELLLITFALICGLVMLVIMAKDTSNINQLIIKQMIENNKQDSIAMKMIGDKFVINGDTLAIVDYSDGRYTMSNSVKIAPILIKKCVSVQ